MENLCRKPEVRSAPASATARVHLERVFVETGDERCPIAGLWLKIADPGLIVDEPPSTMPAMDILSWRAFHPLPTSFCYSAA